MSLSGTRRRKVSDGVVWSAQYLRLVQARPITLFDADSIAMQAVTLRVYQGMECGMSPTCFVCMKHSMSPATNLRFVQSQDSRWRGGGAAEPGATAISAPTVRLGRGPKSREASPCPACAAKISGVQPCSSASHQGRCRR